MSNSSELINKLELLHKMKEEGKLSDEEYNLMKNKVMSAFTGKEIPSVSGVIKPPQEAANIKQEKKENVNTSQLKAKTTEETKLSDKLDQLYKMKEEGKLSDEEYNFMKNKVMSALTGKVIQNEPDSKKNSDETPIKKQEEETKISETHNQKILSEDTGPAGKIEQLNLMKENGMISEEEFNSMKSKILLSMIDDKEKLQTESKQTNKDSSPETNVFSSLQSDTSKGKIQISKKIVYLSLGIIFVAAVSFIIYTELNKKENNDLKDLTNKLIDSKTSGETKKPEPNNSDNWGKLENSNKLEIPDDYHGKLIYEATNGTFNKLSGSFLNEKCGEIVNYSFYLVDLNKDNILEVFQTIMGSQLCYGKEGCITNSFFKNYEGKWAICNNWQGCFAVKMLNTINNGYNDIQLVTGNSYYYPTWKWNGSMYELLNSVNNNTSSDPNSDDNKENSVGKENLNLSQAENTVRSWVEALGKRDFESAFNLMSPSLSKGYDAFTSTNRYGGITKTLLHSSETVSSSGCNYVVIASYDSYDPYNRDGKFTERFNVNNCNGDWQITNIRNVNVEYYR